MFAEEIGGNASRRRQDEARARRRKLKQQQEQKKKAEENAKQAQVAPTPTPTANATQPAVPATVSSVAAPSSDIQVPPPVESAKSSAVANALLQRQQRQAAQHQQKAAVTIQSFYRAHHSNTRVLRQQSSLLEQRLRDLSTLTALLKQQGNTEYVPPPATTTALCQQLLFVAKALPYKQCPRVLRLREKARDSKMLQQMIELTLLPGVLSKSTELNPFHVWLQSQQGKYRMNTLLRLCLVVATTSNVDQQAVDSCLRFVDTTLGIAGDAGLAPVASAVWSTLMATTTPVTNDPPPTPATIRQRAKPIANLSSSLDLISLLRFHLMYCTGGPEPIPPASDRVREACIPGRDRIQADALFQEVFRVITVTDGMSDENERRQWWLRFVSEILTVPLLTWKISDKSTSMLLSRLGKGHKMFLMSLIENFTACHGNTLASGDIALTLCQDTSLTTCPATPTQCLLANLLQAASSTAELNGFQVSKLNYGSATVFYQFIATLVDAIPFGTMTSRDSVVEWIYDNNGHHAPVVLSTVIMEQCKYLLVDSYARRLFHCAIDVAALKTDQVLKRKTDKDLKQEAALSEAGVSATALAAKEARTDRTKGFWNSSSWARKMTKGVSRMLGGDNGNKKGDSNNENKGNLIDASAVSRKLAMGGAKGLKTSETTDETARDDEGQRVSYTPDLFIALCRVYGIVLARWGGGGGEDIVHPHRSRGRDGKPEKQIASTTADPCTLTLLNLLCFSTSVISASWAILQSDNALAASIDSIVDQGRGKTPVCSHSIRPSYGFKRDQRSIVSDGAALLFVFVSSLSHVLIVTDDTELHDLGRPVPLHQLRRCIQSLKQLLYRACCLDDVNTDSDTPSSSESNYFGLALIHATSRAMKDLYDRSSRHPLAVPKLWLIEDLLDKELKRCKSEQDYVALLSSPVLRVCPFLVPFKRRLRLFERIITTNRVAIQGENSQNPFHTNPLKPGLPVRITRGRILEDGLATMNNLGSNMRQRLAVQYQNEAGTRETGVDAGGLFKEFWTDLCAIAFDPNYALFRVTGDNCMYPNPSSSAAHGADHIMLFEFLGRILGKALYEGITVHPQFAHFFLSHLRGDYNYLHMLSDLSTMDSQLYQNIMFLKTYEGDAEDLCLTFTVANDDFGGNTEIPLMPNGAEMSVTNANKQRYIGLVAKYYVVDRIKEQSDAFTRGLREVIDKGWLRIFNEPELQVLISGASDGKIDVEDMRSNCRYAGGFTGIDRTVNRFWSVVATLDSKQQADLLRFVTSCERPPPLGFSSLNPPFTIQRVGILRDGDKLPASSTCFNTLKLPTYSSEKVMKERILYAIQSGAGFELT